MKRKNLLLVLLAAFAVTVAAVGQVNTVRTIAPHVYFHEGDMSQGNCNNGWVAMQTGAIVIDANYPSGAQIVIPKVKATTGRPARYVIDTHFHPDHSFGNQLWADDSATIVAQAATLEELVRSGAAAWILEGKKRPDVAASRLKLPDVVYTDSMVFVDDHHRVELHWPGPAHTHGDTLVWLPREKILFTGDMCVNGAYNYLHDSDLAAWIKALDVAKAFGAETICPGHGPMGGPEIIVDQQRYFVELRRRVQELVAARKSAGEVGASVSAIASEMRKIAGISRYVPTDFWFKAHVEKAFVELGGEPLPP